MTDSLCVWWNSIGDSFLETAHRYSCSCLHSAVFQQIWNSLFQICLFVFGHGFKTSSECFVMGGKYVPLSESQSGSLFGTDLGPPEYILKGNC